jgi:hypothetical protein
MMTFKDPKKIIATSNNQQQQQQITLFSSGVWNKPFWIWNIEEHKAGMTEYEIVEYLDGVTNPQYLQGVMGLDPGCL